MSKDDARNHNKEVIEQFEAIMDFSSDGLWICDSEGKVIRINRASEKINSVTAVQVLKKKMTDLVSQGLVDRSVTLEVLKTRTAVTIIQKLNNGKELLVTGSPVFNERGEISLVVVNERDITALNKLRAELEAARARSKLYLNELSDLYRERDLLSRVIIRSESMIRVYKMAVKVAKVDSTVVLQGESGVGKGFFAKIIHNESERREAPFIRVDCGALPESLLESELFGYEEGAFTGARPKGKTGQFEAAEGGTLFLDEVGDIPLNVQLKLLRFLEEGEMVRVGGTKPRKINVRVVAATQHDLAHMVKKGDFRKDLFFRLHVVPIRIPPLRERKEEIPPLIRFFLDRFNAKCSEQKIILPRAVDRICCHPFPGNIRELANLVERLVVLTPGECIDVQHLPLRLRGEDPGASVVQSQNAWNLRKAVEALEENIIHKALKRFGSQRRAARPLGINQSTLARKIKRYGISSDALLHHDA